MGKGRIATRKSHILKHTHDHQHQASRVRATETWGYFLAREVHTEFQPEGKL